MAKTTLPAHTDPLLGRSRNPLLGRSRNLGGVARIAVRDFQRRSRRRSNFFRAALELDAFYWEHLALWVSIAAGTLALVLLGLTALGCAFDSLSEGSSSSSSTSSAETDEGSSSSSSTSSAETDESSSSTGGGQCLAPRETCSVEIECCGLGCRTDGPSCSDGTVFPARPMCCD